MANCTAFRGNSAILLISILGFTSGCAYFGRSPVVIDNQSNSALLNVHVTMADQEIWTGTLSPGQSHEAAARPSKDGTISISFEVAGQVHHQEFGYVTPGVGQKHTIAILSSYEIKYATS